MDPVKFTFDTSFDAGVGNRHEKELEQLHSDSEARVQEAYQKGFDEGHAQAQGEIESATVAVLEQIQQAATGLFSEFETIRTRLSAESAQIAHMVGLQLAENLLKTTPVSELEAVIHSVLEDVYDVPSLKIRVNAEVADVVEPRIRAMADSAGFDGEIIVAADANLNPQDIYVEWGNGGIRRDVGEIQTRIAQCVDHYVTSLLGEEISEEAGQAKQDHGEDIDLNKETTG